MVRWIRTAYTADSSLVRRHVQEQMIIIPNILSIIIIIIITIIIYII